MLIGSAAALLLSLSVHSMLPIMVGHGADGILLNAEMHGAHCVEKWRWPWKKMEMAAWKNGDAGLSKTWNKLETWNKLDQEVAHTSEDHRVTQNTGRLFHYHQAHFGAEPQNITVRC
jgi:hypothetical protein